MQKKIYLITIFYLYNTLCFAQDKQNIPLGWPLELWKICWNSKKELLDFTSHRWEILSHSKKTKYTKAYQRWYAKRVGLPVDKKFYIAGASFDMVLIPPGIFRMGLPKKDIKKLFFSLGLNTRNPYIEKQHHVVISKSFWMLKKEVTRKQWKIITGKKPWIKRHKDNNDNYPATSVSWRDVKEKFLPAMGNNWNLPTEAQWEYVCRAGTLGRFYWGESVKDMGKYANVGDKTALREYKISDYIDTEDGYPAIAPVGKFLSNAFGCYDMIGNAFEICRDWYGKYPEENTIDPTGPKEGTEKVLRGGSYGYGKLELFCLYSGRRYYIDPSFKFITIGFRLVFSS